MTGDHEIGEAYTYIQSKPENIPLFSVISSVLIRTNIGRNAGRYLWIPSISSGGRPASAFIAFTYASILAGLNTIAVAVGASAALGGTTSANRTDTSEPAKVSMLQPMLNSAEYLQHLCIKISDKQ